jgi:hypothetical protein
MVARNHIEDFYETRGLLRLSGIRLARKQEAGVSIGNRVDWQRVIDDDFRRALRRILDGGKEQ